MRAVRPSDNPNPTSRWLLLDAERHGPEEHLAFAQDVAAEMLRAGATASALASRGPRL